MAKRDPERTKKMRIAVRYLLERNCLHKGNQSRLAEHFHVSRQRVHQIVVEERSRLGLVPEPVDGLLTDMPQINIIGGGIPGLTEQQA